MANSENLIQLTVTGIACILIKGGYIIAMICLFLHLAHGVGSFFQTLGLTNDSTFDVVGKLGKVVSIVLLVGYVAVVICGVAK